MNKINIFSTKRIVLTLFVSFLFTSISLAENGPKAQVEDTMNRIIAEVEANPGDSKKAIREKNLRVIIDERFNFEEMAKRSLGKNWKQANEAQQKEFIATFSELLINTYIGRLNEAKKGMVNILDEKIREPKALIKTTVKVKEDVFPIDYKLLKNDSNWEVYDVIIENVGLIKNYRTEFAGIVRKEGIGGLLVKLKDKVAKL